MGVVLLVGGFIGSTLGVWLFTFLRSIGQIDFVIAVAYVLFLGIIGVLMVESTRSWFRARNPSAPRRKLHNHTWLHGLPFKMRFRRSKLYISALLPLGNCRYSGGNHGRWRRVRDGAGNDLPARHADVGGGGYVSFSDCVRYRRVTFLQSVNNQTVDIVLAMLLVVGSVVGAQIGARVGEKLRGEEVRVALGLIVLAVCARVAWTLVATPEDVFSLGRPGEH